MKYLYLLIVCIVIVSCRQLKDDREGLPEHLRNYSKEAFEKADSNCMRDQNACFLFYHITADTIAERIFRANRKYFGPAFDTKEIRRDMQYWLRTEFFSPRHPSKMPWEIGYGPADVSSPEASRFTCNYHDTHGLEGFEKQVFITNNICMKKLIDKGSIYEFTDTISNPNRHIAVNKLKFLCEFHIDISYRPISAFNTSRTEYYRETITDTANVFTTLDPSNFIYR